MFKVNTKPAHFYLFNPRNTKVLGRDIFRKFIILLCETKSASAITGVSLRISTAALLFSMF